MAGIRIEISATHSTEHPFEKAFISLDGSLLDGQGSIRCLSDPSGALTDTYSYTTFGEI